MKQRIGKKFGWLAALMLCLITPGLVGAQEPPQDKLTYVLVRADVRPAGLILPGAVDVAFGKSMPKEYVEALEDPALSRTLPSGTKVSSFSIRLKADAWRVLATRLVAGHNEMVGDTVWLKPTFVRRGGTPGNRVIVLEFDGQPEVITRTDASGQPVLDTSGRPMQEETGRFIISGQPPDRLDPNTHQLLVRFQQANFPNVVVKKPEKKGPRKAFTAAKGAKDADIYLSGAIAAGQGSKPLYSLESRFAYLHSLKQFGAFGGTLSVNANQESNFDPDSIRAAATYEYVRPFRSVPGTGLILRSNVIGGEFNRKNTVRNLITGLDGTLVLPSAQLGETVFATADFTAGFEAGNNYRNRLAPEGIGAFWRPKFGAAAYLLALDTPVFDRISFNANYEVRLPRSAEIYSEMQGQTEVFSLTRKPRHRVGADLNFLFTEAYGLSLQYRYGTLPPAFKLERPNVKLGFVVQLKQANR